MYILLEIIIFGLLFLMSYILRLFLEMYHET